MAKNPLFDNADDDLCIRYDDPLDRFDDQTDSNAYDGDDDDWGDDHYDDMWDDDDDSDRGFGGWSDPDLGGYDNDCDCMFDD